MATSGAATALFSEPASRLRDYPMYVLPVATVLSLPATLPEHEELLADRKLVEWSPSMRAPVAFISQTWLRYFHFDDVKNSKLTLLKALIRRAADGALNARPHSSAKPHGSKALQVDAAQLKHFGQAGYVWLDFASVPQQSAELRAKAIASITSYIGDSSLFVVLAPGGVTHELGRVSDASTWASRGWCRAEQISNALALTARPNPLLVATSPIDVTIHAAGGMFCKDWLSHPVGRGTFTEVGDASALGPVLHALIERRKAHGQGEGTESGMRWYRVLTACQQHLLQQTGRPPKAPAGLDQWLTQLGFEGVDELIDEGSASGWTPLRYAVYANRVDLVEALLARGADHRIVIRSGAPELGACSGATLLHTACTLHDNAEMVQVLLRAGVDPAQGEAGHKMRCMAYAMGMGHVGDVDALMASERSLGVNGNGIGRSAASFAVEAGCAPMVHHVLAHHPQLMPKDGAGTGLPQTYVGWSCGALGSHSCTKLLLEASFRHDVAHPPSGFMRMMHALSARAMRTPLAELDLAAYGLQSSAIHFASTLGNQLAVQLLLTHGANAASTTSPYGQTPLHCAALAGHEPVCEVLLQAGAPLAPRDAQGRTPRAWARRRGHFGVVELLDTWAAMDALDAWQPADAPPPDSGDIEPSTAELAAAAIQLQAAHRGKLARGAVLLEKERRAAEAAAAEKDNNFFEQLGSLSRRLMRGPERERVPMAVSVPSILEEGDEAEVVVALEAAPRSSPGVVTSPAREVQSPEPPASPLASVVADPPESAPLAATTQSPQLPPVSPPRSPARTAVVQSPPRSPARSAAHSPPASPARSPARLSQSPPASPIRSPGKADFQPEGKNNEVGIGSAPAGDDTLASLDA